MKQRLFITGGAGLVGRNVRELAEAGGWTVASPARAELDLADYDAVAAFIAAFRPDTIVHAAGRVGGIQANIAHPVAFLTENLDVGRNVVLAARKAGIRSLLNLASSCMYPRAAPNPLDESLILEGRLEPTNEGYALAKIVITRLCEYIRREDPTLQYKTLIPSNIYGRYDKFGEQNSHLIPAIIKKIHDAKIRGSDRVEIWGNGLARREFMYAGDLADAILTVVDRGLADLPEVMNVGLGYDYSINEYYEAAAEVIGWTGRFEHDLSKPVGMDQKLVSVKRLEGWGWQAKTSLKQGIEKTYRYFLESNGQ